MILTLKKYFLKNKIVLACLIVYYKQKKLSD